MKQLLIIVLTFFAFNLIAQNVHWQKSVIDNMEPFHIDVDVKTAKKIEKLQGENLVFLDIRTPEEVASGKIQGAIELDMKSSNFDEKLAALDKSKQYMVYCYAGGLSKKVMNKMKDLGFKQVYNLDLGYKAWKESSLSEGIK